MRLAAEQGIAPVVNLIVGFPHETEQDFLDTVAFVERTRPFVRQFCAMAFNYTAGSPLFNEPARFGLRRCGPRFDVVGGPSWQEHREIRRQRYQRLVHEVLGQDAQNVSAAAGGLPVAGDASVITDDQPRTLQENWDAIVAADGLAFYPDWPVAGFYDQVVSFGQSIVNGSATPADALAALGKSYAAGRADLVDN